MPKPPTFKILLFAAALLALPALSRGQIFTWSTQGDAQNNPWMASMVWSGFSTGDDQITVQKLRAHPPGRRCLFLWDQNHAVFNTVADGVNRGDKVFWPAGIAAAKVESDRVIGALSAASIKPDVVLLDDEDGQCSWTMSDAQMIAAANDPHAANLDWPALPITSEAQRLGFDEAITSLERAAMHEGVLADFEQFAPDALTCNFAERICTPEEAAAVPDINSHQYATSSSSGNAQAPGMYLGATGYWPTQSNFNLTIYGVNTLRTSVRHSPVLPWYGSELGSAAGSWGATAYRDEFIRHGLLTCGVQGMLFDPAAGDTAATHFSTILFDLRKTCNGTLPATLLTTDISDYNTQWFASARVDTDATGTVTRLLARVTFAPGATKARLIIGGKTFNVTRPARQLGAWVRWSKADTKALY